MNPEQAQLAREVRDLAERVRVLELENRDLRERVERLENGVPRQSASAAASRSSTTFAPPQRSGGRPQPSSSPTVPVQQTSTRRTFELSATRREAAESVGQFFRRCLEGLPRGLCGRERVELPSRIYVVVRDFEERVYDPVRIFYRWGEVKALVSRAGGQLGDSVFAGFPTEQEARIAVGSADLTWPNA